MGARMAGPAIRSAALAQQLAQRFDVTVLHPQHLEDGFELEGVTIVAREPRYRWFQKFLRDFDAVLTQPLRMHVQHALVRSGVTVVYDMYVPGMLEMVSSQASEHEEDNPVGQRHTRRVHLDMQSALRSGNAFVCASERQRDYWLGALTALGRVDVAGHRSDPSGDALIGVIPFGIPDEPPVHDTPVMRGVIDGIGEDDTVLLWAGGIWNWLDPLTPIKAAARTREELPNLRLCFMASVHPNPELRMQMMSRALELATELGVLGERVFFLDKWVPYEQRHNFLLEADAGISGHFDSLETRFAFRTRFLDHIWGGLPTLTTQGSSLSDMLIEADAALGVPERDVDGWIDAMRMITTDTQRRAVMAHNTALLREQFTWRAIGADLTDFLERAMAAGQGSARTARRWMPEYLWVQTRLQGPLGAVRKLLRTLR